MVVRRFIFNFAAFKNYIGWVGSSSVSYREGIFYARFFYEKDIDVSPPAYIVMMYACFSDISIEQGGSDTSSFLYQPHIVKRSK